MNLPPFATLSDNALLALLQRVYRRSRRCIADLVRILVGIYERRVHLKTAHPSMFEFCVKTMGMSNSSAQRYSVAARLVAESPELLGRIERNEVHLSTLVQLRHHLTPQNAEDLLERARGRNREEIGELLAAIAPRPDAPARMRKIPTPRTTVSVAPVARPVEPTAPARYRVQFNADRETHDRILQARDLMRHTNPTGNLDEVMKYCVRAGVERLEARQRGLVRNRGRRPEERPRTGSSPRHVPRSVRRAVFERDGAQCTYCAVDGQRCSATTLLELHHIASRASGGPDTVENLCVRCRAHNRYEAELELGKEYVEERIRAAQQGAKARPDSSKDLPRASNGKTPALAKGRSKGNEPRTSTVRSSPNAVRRAMN